MRAVHIGIVWRGGQIVRVINPSFEWELDCHHVGADETMTLVRKDHLGIRGDMTLDQLHLLMGSVS